MQGTAVQTPPFQQSILPPMNSILNLETIVEIAIIVAHELHDVFGEPKNESILLTTANE